MITITQHIQITQVTKSRRDSRVTHTVYVHIGNYGRVRDYKSDDYSADELPTAICAERLREIEQAADREREQ